MARRRSWSASSRFSREISIIAVRGLDGSVAAYDPAENVHRDGILRTSTVPARDRCGDSGGGGRDRHDDP